MGIQKQEFYEGAALHMLAREGRIESLRYEAPLFILNDSLYVLLKHSTGKRSPWGFTFMSHEMELLSSKREESSVALALVCGSDGVAAFSYDELIQIAPDSEPAFHVGCHRKHHEHYEISGPRGSLARKIAPSQWQKILH